MKKPEAPHMRRAPRDQTAKVVCFANHKGGCGKTTAVGNIGAALAEVGERTLLIDADPQANLSELFGLDDPLAPGPRLEDALVSDAGRPPEPWTTQTAEDGTTQPLAFGLSVLPCTEELADTVLDRGVQQGFEYRLRDLVAAYAPHYDWILIDTPPGIQALTTMAMLASTHVLVPARPADFDIGGAIKVADYIDAQIAEYNPALEILGVLLSQTDRRWALGREAREALQDAGIVKLPHEIPFAIRVGAAPRYGMPTLALDPDSRVAAAYRNVAGDIMTRLTTEQLAQASA